MGTYACLYTASHFSCLHLLSIIGSPHEQEWPENVKQPSRNPLRASQDSSSSGIKESCQIAQGTVFILCRAPLSSCSPPQHFPEGQGGWCFASQLQLTVSSLRGAATASPHYVHKVMRCASPPSSLPRAPPAPAA